MIWHQSGCCTLIHLEAALPVMAAVAMRKKVVSIGHFSPSLCLWSLKLFLFIRSNQEQLCILIALKIREEKGWAKWARWTKKLKITQPDNQLCLLTCFLVYACLNQNICSSVLKSEKKSKINELNELEFLKPPSQMSSSAHWNAFLYLLA